MPPSGGQTTARSRRAARRRTPSRAPAPPPAPSARQVANALAQRRAYVSQGKAVEHVANRQRRQAAARRTYVRSLPLPSQQKPKFTPGLRGTPAPKPQTAAQRAQSQRAAYVSQGQAVEHVAEQQRRNAYARMPVAQRKAVLVRAARKALGGRAVTPVETTALRIHHERHAGDVADRRRLGTTRRQLARDWGFPGVELTGGNLPQFPGVRRSGGNFTAHDRVGRTGGDFTQRDIHGRAGAAAHVVSRQSLGSGGIALPARFGLDLLRTAVEKPKVATRVPGDLLKYAVGAPAGLAETIAHPNQAVDQGIADYVRRYGPFLSGDDKAFRDRLKKEGITPELLDVSGVAGGVGAISGRIAQRTAESGALGARALKIATERPKLQISGNVVREQPVSRNFYRNVARAVVDARRARVQAKRAGAEDAPLEVRQAQEQGHVTYTSRRRQQREQARMVAETKGAGVQRLKMRQQREHAASLKNLNSLSKDERRGFAFAHQFGATTVEAARSLLERRRADISAHRLAKAANDPNYTVSKRRDQVPELEWLHQNAEKVFTPNLRRVVKEEQARERRVSQGDPGVDETQAEIRRHQPIAIALGIADRLDDPKVAKVQALFDRAGTPGEKAAAEEALTRVKQRGGETNEAWLARVQKAAAEQGLEAPGYLRSEERPRGVFATMALGGKKATDIPKAYTGSLLRQGIESMDPNVHLQGIARGLKRRQQWNMVARNLEQHAVKTLGGKSMREGDILSLTRHLENQGVDMKSVAFWNPRKFYEASRRAANDTQGIDAGETGAEEALHGSERIQKALQSAVVSPAEVLENPSAFSSMKGFSVVPAAVLKEIEGSVRPEGLVSRSVDVTRGKISRVLLGNPAWLTFQVASNALLSGLAGVGPVDAIKAQRWWKGLSDAEKEALAPEVGIHGWYDEQTRLGATANNKMVNAYRAFKQTGMYQLAHKANPLDAIFKADNAQNNFFRKAVFYNQAKREAYRRMGDNATRMIRAQQGIHRILKMDPKERITAAAGDPKVFEHHARAVRDFLGDYTSYTSAERRHLGRYTMFYGFLRHSLRMTFYTLPVKHPLMTAIGLELGKMHDDELRKIFGVDVPRWEQANAFIKVGGKRRKFAIGRLNPFFNALQFEGPGSLTGLATPLAGIVLDQLAGKNVVFDKPWTVGGSGSYLSHASDATKAQRVKIALAEALHLSPYVRMLEKTGIPGVAKPLVGKQTDESSLLFPDPVQYKPGDAAGRNAQRVAEQRKVSARENVLRSLLPIFGEPAAPIIQQSRDYAAAHGKGVPGAGGPVSPADRKALQQSIRLAKAAARNGAPSEDELRQALRLAKAAAGGG